MEKEILEQLKEMSEELKRLEIKMDVLEMQIKHMKALAKGDPGRDGRDGRDGKSVDQARILAALKQFNKSQPIICEPDITVTSNLVGRTVTRHIRDENGDLIESVAEHGN